MLFVVRSLRTPKGKIWAKGVTENVLGSLEMWCWRRLEKVAWSDHVRNEARWRGISCVVYKEGILIGYVA
jgi:hypothetical protein